MTDLPPEEETGPDWGGILVLTETQRDNIAADRDIAAAWRELPEVVHVLPTHLGEHEDGTHRAAHPLLNWEWAELMLEACDSVPARNELKAERAKGGDWQPGMRATAKARVEKKPQDQRDQVAADNKARRDGKAPPRD